LRSTNHATIDTTSINLIVPLQCLSCNQDGGAGPAEDRGEAWDEREQMEEEREEMEDREEFEAEAREGEKERKRREARARGGNVRSGRGNVGKTKPTVEKMVINRQGFKYCSGTVDIINTKEGKEAGRFVLALLRPQHLRTAL
jgi:hypothetical protein